VWSAPPFGLYGPAEHRQPSQEPAAVVEGVLMPAVTFQVIDGIDKGRVYRELPTPVTIGREEGNLLRLNDERVSRYHAKVQFDNGEVILTDLESTNGTRVNGNVITIRRLHAGDRVGVGRSLLLFGNESEIVARLATLSGATSRGGEPGTSISATVHTASVAGQFDHDLDFILNVKDKITLNNGNLFAGDRLLPPLPQKLSPSQAARLAELLDFLHRQITQATENMQSNEEATQITLAYGDWQRVLAVQMLLARYARAVSDPDCLDE
jgi:pSer/pThr/pTyr-binding forkhead associated (FHA) protein